MELSIHNSLIIIFFYLFHLENNKPSNMIIHLYSVILAYFFYNICIVIYHPFMTLPSPPIQIPQLKYNVKKNRREIMKNSAEIFLSSRVVCLFVCFFWLLVLLLSNKPVQLEINRPTYNYSDYDRHMPFFYWLMKPIFHPQRESERERENRENK